MYKENLALNNLQCLLCDKIKTIPTYCDGCCIICKRTLRPYSSTEPNQVKQQWNQNF